MNEPHDLPDINRWAQTMQTVVTAIRKAGYVEHEIFTPNGPLTSASIHRATTNLVLLPGNSWTSAATFVSGGSADALDKVTNLDGSKTNIAFDIHRYSDSDYSGAHTECVTNNIDDTFRPLAEWLRCHGRQALNTEMGGGNTSSCSQYICQQIKYMNQNSDGTYSSVVLHVALLADLGLVKVYLGYIGWAAGSFNTNYELSLTPTNNNGKWSDASLLASCLKPQ